MPNFTTPTPNMQTKIKRHRTGLNAQVTITAPNGLQLVTTLAHDIQVNDDKIGVLKRRLVHLSTAMK